MKHLSKAASVFWEAGENTAWKESSYEIIFGPYFPVFSPNTG